MPGTDTTQAENRTDYFRNGVIVMLTLVSVFTALVTFLQNYASLRSSDLAEQSSFHAVDSSGLYFRAGLEAAQGTDVLQRYEDYVQRAVRADTKARALRMGGRSDLAAEYFVDSDRWRLAAAAVRTSDPLLVDFNEDQALYLETLSEVAYFAEEREYTLLDQSRAWNSKANSYVAVLSTLSVALFLAGLSVTIGSRLRILLALASAGLTAACAVWVLVITLSPVPRIPESAIQQFVQGRIQYQLSIDRDLPPTQAIAAFDEALAEAPEYGRAYFYRSLANTDLSLLGKELDTQQAIEDALRAVELGNTSAPVYGNLGWLYYLNGQYNSALAHTTTALAMAPNDCYLPFNLGLILMALERPSEADAAYTRAIDCAQRESSDRSFNFFMDVGVANLDELARARPDLAPGLEPGIRRLKEALASVRMYGEVLETRTPAQFGALSFGASVDSENIVYDVEDVFPQSTTVLYAQLQFDDMRANRRWMTRWLLNGQEYLTTVYETWDYGSDGTTWVSVFNNAGLNSGLYELNVFVEGSLVARGQVEVLPGPLPPMYYYRSTAVGVTISYPLVWNVTDLADNEVSVIAARDADTASFFGVTAWVAGTGTDQDIFDLFQLYFDALQEGELEFTSEARQPTTVAGSSAWRAEYSYRAADGTPLRGALAGVLDARREFSYIVVLESHADDWDALAPMLDVMLQRLTIDD